MKVSIELHAFVNASFRNSSLVKNRLEKIVQIAYFYFENTFVTFCTIFKMLSIIVMCQVTSEKNGKYVLLHNTKWYV